VLLPLVFATSGGVEKYPQTIHMLLLITCGLFLMLAARNDEKSSNDAVFSGVLLATMKAQQAVAIRFVGRRVTPFDVPFF